MAKLSRDQLIEVADAIQMLQDRDGEKLGVTYLQLEDAGGAFLGNIVYDGDADEFVWQQAES